MRGAGAGASRTFRRDALAWLVLAAAGGPAVGAAYCWSHRALIDPAANAGGVREARLAVLAFDRVVEEPDGVHLDRGRLRAHLLALAGKGFRPVTLRQVAAFYFEGEPLPPRSLLLTFDHGYLSTAVAVDPLLRERRWPGVLFLATARPVERDPSFVLWPRLRRMLDSGIWEVGSHGHRGDEQVPADARGGTAPFFGGRAWKPERGGVESAAELEERLAADQLQARRVLEDELGGPPLAWAPPLRQSFLGSRDPELAAAIAASQAAYPLVFEDGPFGVNDRDADPHRLRRLRVGAFWSTAELTARLLGALAEPADAASTDAAALASWVSWAGRRGIREGEVVATGRGRADLWRAGSRWTRDWLLEADVWFEGSQFWLVQGSADREEEWRWGGDANGTHLQTRRRGGPARTLASSRAPAEPGRWHHLRLVRRGAGIWVEWDGRPVAERPGYLPGRWSDSVGCVSWGGEDVQVRLRRPRFDAFPYRAQPVSARPAAAEVRGVIRAAPTLAALSPDWLVAGSGGLTESPLDEDLMRILSHRYGWEIVPGVAVGEAAGGSAGEWLPVALSRSRRAGWSGLRLDLSGLTAAQRAGIPAVAESVRRQLRWPEARLVYDAAGARSGAPAAGGAP